VDADHVLGAVFLGYVGRFSACRSIQRRKKRCSKFWPAKHVVLATPTGIGQVRWSPTAFLFKALCEGKTGFYSCPVKALVNEKFFDLCACFGRSAWACSPATPR